MKLEIETLQKEMQNYDEQLIAVGESIETINGAIKEISEEVAVSKVCLFFLFQQQINIVSIEKKMAIFNENFKPMIYLCMGRKIFQ